MNTEIQIASLVVHVHPENLNVVQQMLFKLHGVELAATDDCGKLVVVVEADGLSELLVIFEKIQKITGVLGAYMVYHQSENAAVLAEEIKDA